MKYYIIVGEASGDMHASCLMRSLKSVDTEAEFRFFGGDLMTSVGGTCVRHYRDLAYMGIIPVLLHLRVILSNMSFCRHDIVKWNPDVLILVDYPSFNLRIANYVHTNTHIPVYYYISPKIWAWKEFRIKSIKRYVDELFSILPFEIPFFEKKHGYRINYVGNPTAEEVDSCKRNYKETEVEFYDRHSLIHKPIIALLAGSRKQEIRENLPRMIESAGKFTDYQIVVAGAPGIPREYYDSYIKEHKVGIVFNDTYPLLSHSVAALVTSGTATLETALLCVPQVVCYYMSFGKIMNFSRRHVLHIKYISLVNLIADKNIVTELVADLMTVGNVSKELSKILPGQSGRVEMLEGYKLMRGLLEKHNTSVEAATKIYELLKK